MNPSVLPALLAVLASWAFHAHANDAVPLSERTFRVIGGTESPDKRFAIGVGRATDRVKPGQSRWIKEASAEEIGDTDSLPNYVVDLREESILDETGCGYPSADPNYNRASCTAHWSPDSRTVVQVTTFHGRYGTASLLRIDADGRRVSTPFDLQAAAEERAITFLKKKRNRAWSEDKEFAVKPLFLSVTNDTVAMTVWGEVVHSHKRDDRWAVRVKARIATNDQLEVRPEFFSVRYPHEGNETESKLSHQSPDGRVAMRIVHEAGHELWSSLFLHRVELVTLPAMRVVAQLLPANEIGTTFLVDQLKLVWSEDSKWCAFHFAYSEPDGSSSGYTIVFRESGDSFVAANKANQLRSTARDRAAEGRLSEDVVPVRWIKPGSLLLGQSTTIVADAQTEITWRLEAGYDSKKGSMQILKVKELSTEEAEKLEAELETTPGKK